MSYRASREKTRTIKAKAKDLALLAKAKDQGQG